MKDEFSDVIERLIRDSRERALPPLTSRDVELPHLPGKALVVIGMRRSGKTFALYQEMRRLLDSGVSAGRILYLNFEDDRLQPMPPDILDRALEAFYRLEPSARAVGAFIFLDEIQVVEGWARFARRVLDTEDARLYLSGSSAKMLSTEVATEFRGRGFAVEVLPFSFGESLRHGGIEPPAEPPGARVRSELEARLLRYLEVGGFPEVQNMDARVRVQVLQDYVELVLLRDVIERHSISNVHAARAFTRAVLLAHGSRFSVNKTYNDLRSRGVEVGKDTLHALLDHLTDAFLVFGIQAFRRSLRARQVNPRKMYAVDPGLAFATSHAATADLGARLETAVYLELRRRFGRTREGAISYYVTSGGHEVDFVVGDVAESRVTELVQVCADISAPATRARECRALGEAMEELGRPGATIVTLHEEGREPMSAGEIRILPAWRWLLGLA
ncbi:MAG: ATP-binding protein [Thermoleophilia bacterium]|nr:ATP-binding protein [Thermoleophilia bacterium]